MNTYKISPYFLETNIKKHFQNSPVLLHFLHQLHLKHPQLINIDKKSRYF